MVASACYYYAVCSTITYSFDLKDKLRRQRMKPQKCNSMCRSCLGMEIALPVLSFDAHCQGYTEHGRSYIIKIQIYCLGHSWVYRVRRCVCWCGNCHFVQRSPFVFSEFNQRWCKLQPQSTVVEFNLFVVNAFAQMLRFQSHWILRLFERFKTKFRSDASYALKLKSVRIDEANAYSMFMYICFIQICESIDRVAIRSPHSIHATEVCIAHSKCHF